MFNSEKPEKWNLGRWTWIISWWNDNGFFDSLPVERILGHQDYEWLGLNEESRLPGRMRPASDSGDNRLLLTDSYIKNFSILCHFLCCSIILCDRERMNAPQNLKNWTNSRLLLLILDLDVPWDKGPLCTHACMGTLWKILGAVGWGS